LGAPVGFGTGGGVGPFANWGRGTNVDWFNGNVGQSRGTVACWIYYCFIILFQVLVFHSLALACREAAVFLSRRLATFYLIWGGRNKVIMFYYVILLIRFLQQKQLCFISDILSCVQKPLCLISCYFSS
jgi:hypothetical protein